MKWLRLYHETIADPKWRVVANDCGQPEANVLAVWMHMMVNASESKDRGVLEGWNDRVVAASLGIPTEAVTAIRDAMQGLVLDGMRLTGWDKRQRVSDNVAERKRREREQKNGPDDGGGGSHGTNGAGPVPNGHVTRQNECVTRQSEHVTRQFHDVADFPLRAQIQTQITEEIRGSLCVSSASSPAQAQAHAHTREAARSAEIIPFGGRVAALPDGWLLPDDWREWAESVGASDIDYAADRFHVHWLGKRDRGDRDAANSEAVWLKHWRGWINGNLKRERDHGRQSHNGRNGKKPAGGLAAYARTQDLRDIGDAEGDPDDGGWRVIRG